MTFTETGYSIAIIGATGLVGRNIVSLLETSSIPIKRLLLLASPRSAGQTLRFKGTPLPVLVAAPELFEGIDLVLASAGGSVSAKLLPEAVKRGAVCIDNSSHFRMDPAVPLVVASVNDADIAKHQGIIANPNCSTAQLMPVLKALDKAAGLHRVIVSTYQSVSGAGETGIRGLLEATEALLPEAESNDVGPLTPPFKRPMAFNLIPHIDVFCDTTDYGHDLADYTKEEVKLVLESRKILGRPNLAITATAIRVPVLVGHSESVTVELEQPLTVAEATDVLRQTPYVVVADNREGYHTPREIAGTDPVYVSRIRRDSSNARNTADDCYGLNLWVVADNLRIGAALNAVRLAELVLL
ncbi:MAG: aspartate-semialdehyde dehydrogenase [Vampirovibrionales bacterium]|nr:aspartate-semialdehyde dehydrogenase [Vampirovibrionales bacterium]